MEYSHIFGPVASRRLGVSLGVDLVTHKVCSLDCVYCECGKTTDLTLKRMAWVPFEMVKAELDHYWARNTDPDYITFSGSGEPCLNSDLGRVIAYIKEKKPNIQVAVLTNATLLTDKNVREELALADLVVPSLDGVSKSVFTRINRPRQGVDPEEILSGIQTFALEFKGKLNLEIFIVPGVNDTPKEISLFKAAILSIDPDLVQLNTLDRPGTREDILPASRETLEFVKKQLGMDNIQIIARVPKIESSPGGRDIQDLGSAVIETIHRRPCTSTDLASMLGVNMEQIQILLDDLVDQGQIEARHQTRGVFYQTIK